MGLETQSVCGSTTCWVAENSYTASQEKLGFCVQPLPIEGFPAPLLWSLVVDELTGLNENDCYTLEYGDDIAILISRKLNTMSELLHEALSTVQQCCDRTQLSINPQKTVIVTFTRKRDLRSLEQPTLFGRTLQLTTEFKYLGLILDKGLT
jgi:Reverse transcriptase (RNA-dependent DNA polymerase).